MRKTKISLQISILGNLSTNMQQAKCWKLLKIVNVYKVH